MLILKTKYTNKIIPLAESDFKLKNYNEKVLTKVSANVLELNGPLFFGSIESILDIYANSTKHDILIINMSNVTMIDLSGSYALEDLIKGAQAKGIKILVSNIKPNIKKVLEKLNFSKNIGEDCYNESIIATL